MRAVVIEEYGDVEVLKVQEVPDPEPGPDEVIVDIVSTAVNRADVLQRMGLYPGPKTEFEIPGLEFAGRVLERGRAASAWSIGDEVMGVVAGGAYAERIAVHERQVMAVPQAIGIADSGGIPEVFITAWDALVVQGGLTAGRKALVHAGASGVGTAAIQICRAMGAQVAVTASAGKHEVCHSLGADVVIDYKAVDFADEIKRWTDGAGVDVVLDVIGGDYVNRNIASLRVGGRIIQVGVMGNGAPTVAIGALLPKRASIIGTVLRARPLEEKIAITQRFAAEVLPLFTTSGLAPVVDARYTLDTVAEAHERMQSNANAGKLMIDVGV